MSSIQKTILPQILLVDDEESLRITLSEFLIDAGFNVNVTKDAKEALVQLKKKKFDVVVTDIIMPQMTGMKLLEEIKKLYPESNTEIRITADLQSEFQRMIQMMGWE